MYEDLLNIKGETESTMRGFNATILKLSESLEKEAQERNEFIERIPKTIEIVPSEDYLNLNKALEKNSNRNFKKIMKGQSFSTQQQQNKSIKRN